MTFLELVRRLHLEGGISGAPPSTVTGQVGDFARAVTWASAAWNDIQISQRDWLWMRSDFSFATTAGQMAYTSAQAGIATRFSHWLPGTVSLSQSGPGDELPLDPLDYESFRASYIIGPQTQGRPVNVSIAPNKNLLLGYVPNLAYNVRGEYQKSPQILTLDSDEPEMPSQYHDLIVYKALVKYARFFAAGEIYEDAVMNERRLMGDLKMHELPSMTGAGTLV